MVELPKICLLYTGGTIGMVRDESSDELRPPEDPRDFVDQVAPELKEIVELHFEPLMNKDSTNVNHHDWTTIAMAINDRFDGDYDGFVVAHGTDTMHFSASAVAFALGANLPCPVVFTGAQTVPAVQHGDARINLVRACKVALEDIGEVLISFGDYVFRGCRAQKKDEARFDAFESPAQFPLAYVTEQILINPMAHSRSKEEIPPPRADFAGGVLQVSLIPGLRPDLVEPAIDAQACRGVILQSFGAGNVPDEGDYTFIPLIERCVQLRKPVIVTSQFPANSTLHTAYAPGRRAVEAGAIPTSNMTGSCAVAKFRWALAQAEESIDPIKTVNDIMSHAYVEEMDEVVESTRSKGSA
jgi:L-asparaginase